ncbi:MAG: hypothetical protein JWO91_3319 [Acidobacteriaceae bacterium]|nr:hypothetical protein [Acidobacteriaceae bacterium]
MQWLFFVSKPDLFRDALSHNSHLPEPILFLALVVIERFALSA